MFYLLLSVDDQTRVKLKGLSHDYINANYVNVRLLVLLLNSDIICSCFQSILNTVCNVAVILCFDGIH